MWQPAAPAFVRLLTVRAMLNAEGPNPRVDVANQRGIAHVGDAAHIGQHIFKLDDAQVRYSQRSCGNAATGKINGAKARALGEQCVVGVDGADDLQGLFGGKRLAESLAGSLSH